LRKRLDGHGRNISRIFLLAISTNAFGEPRGWAEEGFAPARRPSTLRKSSDVR
jgi:hypothetical protein